MYRYFGDVRAFDLFNNIAIYAVVLASVFLIKEKTQSLGLWSRYAVFSALKMNTKKGKILEYFLAFVEAFLFAAISVLTALFNEPFGKLVGTGTNYFGNLFSVGIFVVLLSFIFMANPMEQMDLITLVLPVRLFFVRIACFCQGCCWGIPWEYGPYNHHPNHPGNQVPVQAIEAFFAVVIFAFLLWYRKKAKRGTMFPIYMILYGGTRFFNEFFTDDYPNVLGPFNMYQILCVVAITIGIALYFVAIKYGSRIFKFIDNKHEQLDMKIAMYEKHMRDKKRQFKQQKRKKKRK